jgi:hypothetical protein
MPRRVYDAQDLAIGMTETFNDRPWEYREELPFSWPSYMQNVGDSLAVAYASDKWKPKGSNGKRESELYKHLAESRNRALVQPALLRDEYKPNKPWPTKGPMVSLAQVPLPQHFAVLGLFEEIDLQLYTKGTNRKPAFSDDKDEGVVGVRVRHGMLGGSYIRWSELYDDEKDQPFLFVYTRAAGVCIIVVGDSLDVKKDGIVG